MFFSVKNIISIYVYKMIYLYAFIDTIKSSITNYLDEKYIKQKYKDDEIIEQKINEKRQQTKIAEDEYITNELFKNAEENKRLIQVKYTNDAGLKHKLAESKNIQSKFLKNKAHIKCLLNEQKQNDKSVNFYVNNDKLINTLIKKNNKLRQKLVNNKLMHKLIKYNLGMGEYYKIKKDLKINVHNYDETDDESTMSYLDYVVNTRLQPNNTNPNHAFDEDDEADENTKKWFVTPRVVNKQKVIPI